MKNEDNRGVGEKISGFFHDVSSEARKTTWPHKEELTQSTIVVIISIAMLALFVGLSDWILRIAVSAVTKLAG